MGQCQSASAEDAQEFSDVERATETLTKNSHQYSVEGGKETLTDSKLQDLVTSSCPTSCPAIAGWKRESPTWAADWRRS